MTITLFRADFKDHVEIIDGEYITLNSWELMLKQQLNIKDNDDIDDISSIDIDVDIDTLKTF